MYIPLLVVSFPTTFSTFSNIPHVQSSVLPSIRFEFLNNCDLSPDRRHGNARTNYPFNRVNS